MTESITYLYFYGRHSYSIYLPTHSIMGSMCRIFTDFQTLTYIPNLCASQCGSCGKYYICRILASEPTISIWRHTNTSCSPTQCMMLLMLSHAMIVFHNIRIYYTHSLARKNFISNANKGDHIRTYTNDFYVDIFLPVYSPVHIWRLGLFSRNDKC